ncbi:MAG: hypothetical protein D3924_16480 [Candidatus Electrothrix sp. AR4]|nr:hypothetical protein [Candidatus Electrothrix sp. AR4]
MVELQSDAIAPLWFAVYDKKSGYVAYLEVNPAAITRDNTMNSSELFSTAVAEQINAEHLFDNATEYAEKFSNKIFNGNEFRVVTVANALTVGVPTTAVRAFELHDHYCPGVTSGVVMADYVKKYFSKEPGTRYFVQTVQPWCKEDALLVLLNATPGKKSYSVTYPTEEDLASRPEWAQDVSTVVYRYNSVSEFWEGIALSFNWGDNNCPDYGHVVMNKLCKDLQFIDQMDKPEKFVDIEKSFTLPRGVHPKEYARPGVDPLALLNSI